LSSSRELSSAPEQQARKLAKAVGDYAQVKHEKTVLLSREE
jgi:hypothetical protein